MKNLFKFIFAGLFIMFISSCAMHTGTMNNSVSLSEANFGYTTQSISGTAGTILVFGIGGLDRMALVEEAKKAMLKDHPLQANQALANITVNWKNSFYLVVFTTECTVTADVVEFK